MKNLFSLYAALFLLLGAVDASSVEVLLTNPGFQSGTNPAATGWTPVDGGGTNSTPSNYAEVITGLAPNRTMQLKSDGGNYVQQTLVQEVDGNPIDAASFSTWTVRFLAGYRRDSTTNGDHTLRVSLWNTATNNELAASEFTLADPGLGTNSLSSREITLDYAADAPGLGGAPVALRFTSVSTDLGGNAWRRTAILDDVEVFATLLAAADPRLAAPMQSSVTSSGNPESFAISISNSGQAETLTLNAANLSGPDAERFAVTSFPNSLAPGEAATINLLFTPSGLATNYQATLTLLSNDAALPTRTVQLLATVNNPEIAYRAWAISFGLDPETDGARYADPDGDGVPNEEEFRLASSPINPASPDARAWLPRPEKTSIMVFSAHPDDEGIFFGGALPYYSQVREVPILLVAVTSGDYVLPPTTREQEMRNAAWVYGMRYQPIFPRFKDSPFANLDQNFNVWGGNQGAAAGRLATATEFAKWIRRYRPDVVLTHDFNGEYGHMNHRAVAAASDDAIDLAADPNVVIEGLSPWQVKKLYVNQLSSNPIFHDFWEDISIDTTGNGIPDSSPRQRADLGLAEHKTQNSGNFRVSTVYRTNSNPSYPSWDNYPSEHWGLRFTTVGPDSIAPVFTIMGRTYSGWARGNFLENITAFPDQDGDGLPDAWEQHWFGSPTIAQPHHDENGDGRTNLENFVLGLNPHAADAIPQHIINDTFEFALPNAQGPGYAGLTRHFEVLFSTDLDDWQPISSGTADGSTSEIPLPIDDPTGFVRLRVEIR